MTRIERNLALCRLLIIALSLTSLFALLYLSAHL